MKRIILFLLLSLSLAFAAYGAPITVNFVVDNFTPSPAPTDPVTGTIVYDSSDVHSIINSLTSVNMTIGGHSYNIGELGYISPFVDVPNQQLIGGKVTGTESVSPGTDDFYIIWYTDTLQPRCFAYTVQADSNTYWYTTDFKEFSVTSSAPVPEPITLLLLSSGLIGLTGFRKIKK